MGVRAGAGVERTPGRVSEEADEVSAVHDDGVVELVPECSIEIAGPDAEITADIGDDGADRATAHLGGDFLFRGQAREAWVLGGVGGRWFGLGVRRCGLSSGAWPGCGGCRTR